MFICVDSGEEGVHKASISFSVECWQTYQGICLRAVIGYLYTLLSKKITHTLLLEEGIIDSGMAIPQTREGDVLKEQVSITDYEARISDALLVLRSWARKKRPCYLRSPLDMDIMRQLAEAQNSSVYFDKIPHKCPTVLTELKLGGIYHILRLQDHGVIEYKETLEVSFILQKIIWYTAHLFRKRKARMDISKRVANHGRSASAVKAELEGSDDEDRDIDDYEEQNPITLPYGIARAENMRDETIVEIDIDTVDGRLPGYCILNDCIEFSYGLGEVFTECEPGERITVGGSY